MPAVKLDTRTRAQFYADLSEIQLRCRYLGAWDATDADTARMVKTELRRRGVDVSNIPWPREER